MRSSKKKRATKKHKNTCILLTRGENKSHQYVGLKESKSQGGQRGVHEKMKLVELF